MAPLTPSRFPPYRLQKAIGHFRNLAFPTLHSMFYNIILHQLSQPWSQTYPPFSYYEFGVGWGETLTSYVRAVRSLGLKGNLSSNPLILFDTFAGLPRAKDKADMSPRWEEGSFAHSVPYIRNLLTHNGVVLGSGATRFVVGTFDDTLTTALQQELASSPPSIVTIDVDYYSSTRTVLEWIEPLLHDGTVFYFDDIDSHYGNPDYGELKALNEFNESGKGYLARLNWRLPALYDKRVFIYSRKEFGLGWAKG